MLSGMMTILLAVTGVTGGITVSPVVVAEEGNGKVTLRYDLVPTGASPRTRRAGAVHTPGAGPFLDWDQTAEINSSSGALQISGTNPTGNNGSVRRNGQATVGRLSWNGNQYGWRIPDDASSVEYYNIDVTGYDSCTSVEVWANVCAKGGNAGPLISINGSGNSIGNVGETWELQSISRDGGVMYWNSADNGAEVTETSSSTDTLGLGLIRIYIYGAHPIPRIPGPFNLALPHNHASNQPTSGTLVWTTSSSATYYDVYFGPDSPPPYHTTATETSYSYVGSLGLTYYWNIQAENGQGGIRPSADGPFCFTITSVAVDEGTDLNNACLGVSGAFPNPFRDETSIRYALPRDCFARLRIVSATGSHVRSLCASNEARGPHQAVWDGLDARGLRVAKGIYFCTLEADGLRAVQRIVKLE